MVIEFKRYDSNRIDSRKINKLESSLNVSIKETVSNIYGTEYYKYLIKNIDNKRSIRRIRRILSRKYKVLLYDEKYERSDGYRRTFISNTNKRKYRCVYCGKMIRKDQMQVDHLIPVRAAQTSRKAQRRLFLLGCQTVNDSKNLVPSCAKCNNRKGYQMGIWYWKGLLGKSELYWTIRCVVRLILLLILISLIYALYTVHDFSLLDFLQ